MNDATMERLKELIEDDSDMIVGRPFELVQGMFGEFAEELVAQMVVPVETIGPSVKSSFVNCSLNMGSGGQRDAGEMYFLARSLVYLCRPRPLYVRYNEIQDVVIRTTGAKAQTYNMTISYVRVSERVRFEEFDASSQNDVEVFLREKGITIKHENVSTGEVVDLEDGMDLGPDEDDEDEDYKGDDGSNGEEDDDELEFEGGEDGSDSDSDASEEGSGPEEGSS